MRKRIRSFLCLSISAFLTGISVIPIHAEDEPASLSDQVQTFVDENGLDSSSFALLYYNTETGESYEYNPDTALFCASIYKLPLNMLYYDKERSGELSQNMTILGYDLADAHYQSIVQSNNDVSDAMIYAIGTYQDFKRNVCASYGGDRYGNADAMDPIIYQENDFPAGLMMSVVKYLWDHQSDYSDLLSLMSAEDQRNGFEQNIPDNVTVYQKQGWYPQTNTVCEIVMEEQPYLCVIMVNNRDDSSDIILGANALVYEYHTGEEMAEKHAQEETEEKEKQAEAQATAAAEKKEKNTADAVGITAVAVLTAICVGVIIKQAISKE
jgi:hypothetical protein